MFSDMVALLSRFALLLACVGGHVSELPAIRTWRGYCAVTPSEPSDCTAGSLLTKERLIRAILVGLPC